MMNRRVSGLVLILAASLTGFACDADNPARPSVTFLAPVALGPAANVTFNFSQQPVELLIDNVIRTGHAVATYDLEVASSGTFATIVANRPGIAEGTNGRTSVTLPQLEGNATYFWRSRAVVDGIPGQFSAPRSFFVRQRVTVGQPAAQSPSAGAVIVVARPTFVVANAAVTGPNDPITYDFEVSSSNTFASLVASATVAGGASTASWTSAVDIAEGTFFWRSRAKDVSNGVIGTWTDALSFVRRNVVIGAPTPSAPAAGQVIIVARPALVVTNAQITGQPAGAITYDFEVSQSSTFSSILASATVPVGASTTSWTLTTDLPEGTIYWRARAKDATGGATGPFSGAASFVRRLIAIGKPTPQSPAEGEVVGAARPTFVVRNSDVSGPTGAIQYDFQVSTSSTFSSLVASGATAAGVSTTSWTSPADVPVGQLYWRARGRDDASGASGEFSNPVAFQRRAFAHPLDQLDIRAITMVDRDVDITEWPVTSNLEEITYDGSQLCTYHTKAGLWPTYAVIRYADGTDTLVEGNQWFFANINGKWYGGTNEYLRPGQFCKPVIAGEHVGDGGYGGTPMETWTPGSGELVGIAVTTVARFGQQTAGAERSQIILFRWP